jgi:hypothetical protein
MNDAGRIKELLRKRVAELAPYLFPNGHREKNHWHVGSIDGEPGHSFDICVEGDKAGLWGDWASGEKHSRNLLDLWMRARNVDFTTALHDAAHWLGVELQSKSKSEKLSFETLDKAVGFMVRKLKMLSGRRDWYHDENGNEHFVMVRFDGKKKKDFRPFHQNADRLWLIGDPAGKLPMFHLPKLLVPDLNPSMVFVVEGEKVACKLEETLGVLATTSAHGAKSPHKTDWSPLAGCFVVILPDNDETGQDYAQKVAGFLMQLGATVKIVQLPDLPEKGDAVEWLAARNGKPTEEIKAELLELVKNAQVLREAPVLEPCVKDDEDDLLLQSGDFPLDALNSVQRLIAKENTATYQINPALPAMTSVATLSAAIGKHPVVINAVGGRTMHLNLYVTAGAPKSYGKHAASNIVDPLRDASNEITEYFEEFKRPELKAELKILELQEKVVAKECVEEPSKENRKRLAEIQKRLDEIRPLLKWSPTYIIGNATSAALVENLKRSDATIFSFAPEAGDPIRIALGKYSKDDAADFDLYLSGYTVESFRESRIGRGDTGGNFMPCISVLWFCQPLLLRELFTNEEALERGLTARVLPFVVEWEGDIPEDDGVLRNVSQSAIKMWDMLVRAMLQWRTHAIEIRCSDEAREIFRAFHNEAVALRNGKYRAIEGELGRWRENAIKVAGQQCIADAIVDDQSPFSQLVLTPEHAERGVAIARWPLRHSVTMFNKAMADRQWRRVQTLLDLRRRY